MYYVNLIIRGDSIKRNIGIIILAISLCLVFTKALFSTYREEQVMISSGNIYLLQYGSYLNEEVMNENISKLEDYLIYQTDNKYYVHIGVYTNIDTANKMKKYFENKNIYTYIKNDYLSDTELINSIKDYDNKLLNEKKNSKIIELNKKILDLLKNNVS